MRDSSVFFFFGGGGDQVQDTGVAPTDDGFTILERRTTSETEEGCLGLCSFLRCKELYI